LSGTTNIPYPVHAKRETPFGPIRSQDVKDKMMKKLFAQMRAEAEKRAVYRATRDEIARMPRAIALDLGMFPEDAEMIARKAVWG
jgi:hypothetical protein